MTPRSQGRMRRSTRKTSWPGSWSRSRTPDATWCATTGEPGEGPSPQGRNSTPGERPGRGRGVSPATPRAGGAEAPVGEPDPAGVRGGPSGVSSVWSRDARHFLYHGAEGDQRDRGPSAQTRQARASPSSSSCPTDGSQPALRPPAIRVRPGRGWGSCGPATSEVALRSSRREA
jgi:hypothetical protein